jgi:hypothetical protein
VISDNTNQTTKEYIAHANATTISGNTNETTKDLSTFATPKCIQDMCCYLGGYLSID